MTEAEYREWIKAEIRKPEWHVGRPPWPDDLMFGTCFNDDCQGVYVMDTADVALWRRRMDGALYTFQGLCRYCTADLLQERHQYDGGRAE